MALCLLLVELHIRANNQQVTLVSSVCGRAVYRDHTAAPLCTDGVGGEALAVVDIVDVDHLVFVNAGGIKEVLVDCAGALVMQFRMGCSYTV